CANTSRTGPRESKTACPGTSSSKPHEPRCPPTRHPFTSAPCRSGSPTRASSGTGKSAAQRYSRRGRQRIREEHRGLEQRSEVERTERPAAEEAPSLPGPELDVRAILALQRTAGNAAVARLVQRGPLAGGDDPPSDADEIDAGRRAYLARQPAPAGTAPGAAAKTKSGIVRADFESPTPKINLKGGAPTAKKLGDDKVELAGPGIEGSANVKWKPPDQQDPNAPPPTPDRVDIGFIQTVLHSDRGFLYTDDGKPTGKVGREVRDIVPEGSRDARHLAGQKDNKGKPIQGSGRGPFYQEPRSLKRGDSGDVTMTDEPTGGDTPFKLTGSDGKVYTLARITGSDN